jgi:hypothetical protein
MQLIERRLHSRPPLPQPIHQPIQPIRRSRRTHRTLLSIQQPRQSEHNRRLSRLREPDLLQFGSVRPNNRPIHTIRRLRVAIPAQVMVAGPMPP